MNDYGEDQFHAVCSNLDIPRLSATELSFLSEYAAVMKPIAQALNILQSETKMFVGYLLPTLTILREKLEAKRASATICMPLVSALLNGIDERFADILIDPEAVAAAIIHPKF